MTLIAERPSAADDDIDSQEGAARQSGLVGGNEARLVGAITLLAFAVRCLWLGRQSYWVDEGLEVVLANMSSPVEVVRACMRGIDKAPPLYHVFAWCWHWLGGDGETWMRFPSAVFSASVVPATWFIARRLAPRAALGATVLAAASPFLVQYGQEARMYALAFALTSWSLVAFLRAEATGSRGAWFAYVLTRAAAGYTHPYMLMLCLPELVVALRAGGALRRQFLVSSVGLGVLYAPWLVVLAGLRNATVGLPKDASPVAVGYAAYTFIFGSTAGPNLADLHVGVSARSLVPLALVAALLVGPAALMWLRTGSRRVLVAAWIATPVVGAYVLGLTTGAAFNVRYGAAGLPLVFLVLAAGTAALPRPSLRTATAVGLAAVFALSLTNWFANDSYAKEDYRGAARVVQAGYQPGDLVVLVAPHEGFEVYNGLSDGRAVVEYVDLYGDRGLDDDAFEDLKAEALVDGRLAARRTWVVSARPWEADPDGDVLEWFRTHGRVVAQSDLVNANVYELAN